MVLEFPNSTGTKNHSTGKSHICTSVQEGNGNAHNELIKWLKRDSWGSEKHAFSRQKMQVQERETH